VEDRTAEIVKKIRPVTKRNRIVMDDFIQTGSAPETYTCSLTSKSLDKTIKLKITVNNEEAQIEYDDGDSETVMGKDTKLLPKAISSAITRKLRLSLNDLSVREDYQLLGRYRDREFISIREHPSTWISSNAYFARLEPKRFYRKLLNYVCEQRGLFIKVWELDSQKNYFNTSVNGGLPMIKKADEIHEGTFMMHDIFHFLFLDPLITGHENEDQKRIYIAARMLGEACTLVLADMISIAHSGIINDGYDITKRKIYPLFQSLGLDPRSLGDIKKVMYANSVYCLFGDDSEFRKLGASEDALNYYKEKYFKFFSADFQWNEENLRCIYERFEKKPELLRYHENTSFPESHYTIGGLAEKIKVDRDICSFNKLFEVFWEQFDHLIRNSEDLDLARHQKTIALKYISGQLYARYFHAEDLTDFDLETFDTKMKELLELIKAADSSEKLIEYFQQANTVLDGLFTALAGNDTLLPDQLLTYRIHVPHFEPVYVGYDKDASEYEPLPEISNRLLGKILVREQVELLPIEETTQKIYNSLL
jgi:hypothetical protein